MVQILVFGLGDIVHQDKGLGIHAVRDLYQEQWPQHVNFMDRMMLGDNPLNLDGISHLLVLDAWKAGMSPGSLARLSLEQVLAQPGLVSEPALWRGLALADVLGQDIGVVFLGLEAESTACSLTLSSPVQKAYPRFLNAVREEISCMLASLEDSSLVGAAALA